MSNLVRGIVSNSLAWVFLYILSSILDLQKYAILALGLQYFVFMIHGLPQNSEKYYDASGSITHLSLVLMSVLQDPLRSQRQLINSFLVVIWLTRLGSFLFARILSDKQDERFIEIKKSSIRFLGAWSLQAVWVFLVDLPVIIINNQSITNQNNSMNLIDFTAWIIWMIGFYFEVVADSQKSAFKNNKKNQGLYITEGLWKYSRHPNYFGEIIMWIGITVSCSQQFSSVEWMGWLSPLFTTFLLLKVSGVPMIEKLGQKKWGHLAEYQNYIQQTPMLIPNFINTHKKKQ